MLARLGRPTADGREGPTHAESHAALFKKCMGMILALACELQLPVSAYGAAEPHSRNLRKTPPPDSMYRNCDAQELFMSSAKSRTIPPLRVSEELRADAESVLAPGETLSAFVMDAVSRTIDFRKSQLDFLAP